MGLVEVIASLGIAIVVITSLVSLALFTLRSSLQSKLLLQGTKLANEELELVRAYRDSTSWTLFDAAMLNCTASNCYIDSSITPLGGTEVFNPGLTTQITRYFKASDPTLNCSGSPLVCAGGPVNASSTIIRISVEVFWTVGSTTKYAHVYTDLSNWRGS